MILRSIIHVLSFTIHNLCSNTNNIYVFHLCLNFGILKIMEVQEEEDIITEVQEGRSSLKIFRKCRTV